MTTFEHNIFMLINVVLLPTMVLNSHHLMHPTCGIEYRWFSNEK